MGSIASAIHAITEEIATEQNFTIPVGSQPPTQKKAPLDAEPELTISDVFCAQIKSKTGVKEVSGDNVDVVQTRETVARRILEANVTFLPIPKSRKKAT